MKKTISKEVVLKFTVHGNQEKPHGNPMPKAKLTHGQQWTDKAQRYVAWKRYVQDAYMNQTALFGIPVFLRPTDERTVKTIMSGKSAESARKPIELPEGWEARMNISIHWAAENHADPESIFGGIADAIFVNDKHLAGAMEFTHSKEKKGKVEVTIIIYTVK